MYYNGGSMSTITKDMKIAVRVNQALGNRLKQYAKNKGLSVSALLRMFAIEKLEEETSEADYLSSNSTTQSPVKAQEKVELINQWIETKQQPDLPAEKLEDAFGEWWAENKKELRK